MRTGRCARAAATTHRRVFPWYPPAQTSGESMETTAVQYTVWDATLSQGQYDYTFRCERKQHSPCLMACIRH